MLPTRLPMILRMTCSVRVSLIPFVAADTRPAASATIQGPSVGAAPTSCSPLDFTSPDAVGVGKGRARAYREEPPSRNETSCLALRGVPPAVMQVKSAQGLPCILKSAPKASRRPKDVAAPPTGATQLVGP